MGSCLPPGPKNARPPPIRGSVAVAGVEGMLSGSGIFCGGCVPKPEEPAALEEVLVAENAIELEESFRLAFFTCICPPPVDDNGVSIGMICLLPPSVRLVLVPPIDSGVCVRVVPRLVCKLASLLDRTRFGCGGMAGDGGGYNVRLSTVLVRLPIDW